jgi:RHS repeat-associated protein
VVSYRYDPYGAVTITVGGTPQSSDPLGNPWTYTGRFHDEETGLYYYRARYYSPETGRFLQRDPLGARRSARLYEYCLSCPTAFSDPLGLFELQFSLSGPATVPDIQTHQSIPPVPTPESRMPDAFVFQAFLDQWLTGQWWQGQVGPTWLTRFRDNYDDPVPGVSDGPKVCGPWHLSEGPFA